MGIRSDTTTTTPRDVAGANGGDDDAGALESRTRDAYVAALRSLDAAGLPYVVGGRYATAYYTGAPPHPDVPPGVYVGPADHRRALNTLVHAGYRTEYVAPRWHARVLKDANAEGDADVKPAVIDVVYGSANGSCPVDADWFKHAQQLDVLGYATRVAPAEELLWTASFAHERGRCNAADVAHLILRHGKTMDWPRLLRRFHGHERVLLAHCVIYGYVYPTEKASVPDWVLDHLHAAARHESEPRVRLCRGTLLSPGDYAADVADGGFVDARLQPHGALTAEDLAGPPEG